MSLAVRRAVYGKLSGDTTLNNLLGAASSGYSKAIYHNQAPSGAAYPYVVFSKSAGNPTESMGDPSAMETDVWMFKAVDKSTSADIAEAIDDRITVLLNDASLSISGASLLYLRRESDVEYAEISEGVVFQHVGSLYRLITTD